MRIYNDARYSGRRYYDTMLQQEENHTLGNDHSEKHHKWIDRCVADSGHIGACDIVSIGKGNRVCHTACEGTHKGIIVHLIDLTGEDAHQDKWQNGDYQSVEYPNITA